jgi:hypothetical protein
VTAVSDNGLLLSQNVDDAVFFVPLGNVESEYMVMSVVVVALALE